MGGDTERGNYTAFDKFFNGMWSIVETPLEWFRSKLEVTIILTACTCGGQVYNDQLKCFSDYIKNS